MAMLANTLYPMLYPKLIAPSPMDRVLVGCHDLETNPAAANPPIRETDGYRRPLSWRARKLPVIAEPVRRQIPFLPEPK